MIWIYIRRVDEMGYHLVQFSLDTCLNVGFIYSVEGDCFLDPSLCLRISGVVSMDHLIIGG